MENFTKKYSSAALAKVAEKAGYELSPATDNDRKEAASQREEMPRWTLNKSGNQWASAVIRCETLADVDRELDHIGIRQVPVRVAKEAGPAVARRRTMSM